MMTFWLRLQPGLSNRRSPLSFVANRMSQMWESLTNFPTSTTSCLPRNWAANGD